jgi:putative endonuclease
MKEKKPFWHVYILLCQDGSFYTGITNNLENRLKQHNEGKASKYTRCRLPVKFVYSEQVKDRSEATKRELAIKKLTRKQKEKLIS